MIRHLPLPDENDQAVAGTLPRDPFEGLVEQDVSEVVNLSDKLWEKELRFAPRGELMKIAANVALILANDPLWKGTLTWDALSSCVRWADFPPLIAGMKRPKKGEPLADADYTYVEICIRKQRDIETTKLMIVDAVQAAARMRTVNPLTDYLRSLRWDGVKRVATWLSAYLGAPDTEYARMVGQWWLVSAVARAMDPGCKADHMLVLEGKQGRGKSTALGVLGGKWYLENPPNFRDAKAVTEVITGKWIIEVGELDAMRGAAETRIKTFLTQRVDKHRAPYARNPSEIQRMQVFAGTTNELTYLGDHTGNRRFWPVHCTGTIELLALARDRDQLWAEVVALYEAGAPWYPQNVEQTDLLAVEQEQRTDIDAWEDRIAEWLDGREHEGVTTQEVMGQPLALEPGKWDRATQGRVAAALHRLGWRAGRQERANGRVVRRYRPAVQGEE